MKFVVSSLELLSHLQSISRAIAPKSQYPVLDCFLFDLQGKTLKMTASDLEVTMTTTMETDVTDGDGIVALQSKLLLEFLKKLPEQPLTFEISLETRLVDIIYDKGRSQIPTQPGEDFPSIPEVDEAK